MSRKLSLVLAMVSVIAGTPRLASAELRVVTTVPDLAAIVREIGGSYVSVSSMALATQDPHFVDAKPSLALDLNKADLLLLIGMDLEIGWLPTLLTGARNGRIQPGSRGYLDCSQFVARLDVPTERVDRSQGDIHPAGNPHYMFDPRGGALVAKGIAARMAELDPKHADAYQKGLDALLGRLERARKDWEKRLAPARGMPVVTYHKSWVYLTGWLGFEEVGYLEPKPGIPPSPAHVSRLLPLARQKKVRLLIQEEFYPEGTAKLVAQKIPAKLVRLPGGTDFKGGQSYVDHLDQVVKRIEGSL